jgi:hypothetical protein
MAGTEKYPLTEREELRREIRIVRQWDFSRMPNGVESAFLRLEDLDQSRNNDLWDELRHTLAENEHRRHPKLLKFIERPERAEQEYWWYDPAEWSLQAEAA